MPKLLAELRGKYQLRDHPDYRPDWEILERRTLDVMADIKEEIDGVGRLSREDAEKV